MTHPLRKLRHSRGMTQANLAERSGVSLRTVSHIENRTKGPPRFDIRRKLLLALGMEFERHVEVFGARGC